MNITIFGRRPGTSLLPLALACVLSQPVLAAGTEQRILVLGDSLSAGYGIKLEESWVTLLGEKLAAEQCSVKQAADCIQGEWTVVNGSVSGETAGGGLRRLPRLLEKHDPAIVIVELGGNDGLRGYPVSRLRSELGKIIETVQKDDAEALLTGMMIPPNYGPVYTESFQKQFGELATQYDIPLVPFLLDNIVFQEGYMQKDRIHPTAKAQPRILENVWPALHELITSMRQASAA